MGNISGKFTLQPKVSKQNSSQPRKDSMATRVYHPGDEYAQLEKIYHRHANTFEEKFKRYIIIPQPKYDFHKHIYFYELPMLSTAKLLGDYRCLLEDYRVLVTSYYLPRSQEDKNNYERQLSGLSVALEMILGSLQNIYPILQSYKSFDVVAYSKAFRIGKYNPTGSKLRGFLENNNLSPAARILLSNLSSDGQSTQPVAVATQIPQAIPISLDNLGIDSSNSPKQAFPRSTP